MFHIWTKPDPTVKGKRPTVAVIDDDDEFRRAALRLLRRFDLTGVGLIETSAAMRWLTITAPLFVLVDRARVAEVVDVVAGMPVDARPMVIATSHDASAPQCHAHGVRAVVTKPLDADEFLRTINVVLRAGLRKKRVLLVDDDDDIRETYGALLEEEGYEVVPAPNGKAAWNALEGGLRPDVILLDLMMPVMNGHEVWARLQSARNTTPVVVITAGQDASPGGSPILRKPVDMRDLLAAVSRASAENPV